MSDPDSAADPQLVFDGYSRINHVTQVYNGDRQAQPIYPYAWKSHIVSDNIVHLFMHCFCGTTTSRINPNQLSSVFSM